MSFDINKSNNISVTATAETELTTGDLDTGAGTDTRAVVGLVSAESGGGALVGSAAPLPISGTVTADLSATDNAVLDNVQLGTDTLKGPGAPSVDSYTHAAISVAANTANQVLVSSAASKQIWVYGIQFIVGTADGTVSFQDESDTAITGVMALKQNGGMSVSPSGNFAMPIWKLGTDKDLEVDTVTCDIEGSIQYAIVSV